MSTGMITFKGLQRPSVGQHVGQLDFSYTVGGNVKITQPLWEMV